MRFVPSTVIRNPLQRDRLVGLGALALALSLLVFTMTGCSDRGSASIRPDYSAELESTYELHSSSQLSQAVMIQGQQESINTVDAQISVRTGERGQDGVAVLILTIETYNEKTAGGEKIPVDFESARSDDQNRPSRFVEKVRGVIGVPVSLSMSDAGDAGYLRGLPLVEASSSPDEQGAAEGVFAPAWWENVAERIFRIESDAGMVRAGSSWGSSRLQTRVLSLSLSSLIEHEVVSVIGGRVEIEGRGGFTVDFSEDTFANENPSSIEEQAIETRTVWDSTLGRLSEYRSEQVLQIHQTWEGIEVARRYSTTTRVRRLFGSAGSATGSDP